MQYFIWSGASIPSFAEFALLDLGHKKQSNCERSDALSSGGVNHQDKNKTKKRKNVTLVTQAARLDCRCLQYQKKKLSRVVTLPLLGKLRCLQ